MTMAKKKEEGNVVQISNEWPRNLASAVAEIEAIDTEIETLKDGRRQVFKRLKEQGFHTPAVRIIIRERKEEPDVLAEKLAKLEEYREALGDFADTALGQAGLDDLDA